MARCIAHARNGHISTYALKSDVTIVFLNSTPISFNIRENFGYSRTFKADIGILNICKSFQDLLAKMGVWGAKWGKGWCDKNIGVSMQQL